MPQHQFSHIRAACRGIAQGFRKGYHVFLVPLCHQTYLTRHQFEQCTFYYSKLRFERLPFEDHDHIPSNHMIAFGHQNLRDDAAGRVLHHLALLRRGQLARRNHCS